MQHNREIAKINGVAIWDYIESLRVELYNASALAFLMAAIVHFNWGWKYSMSSHVTSC